MKMTMHIDEDLLERVIKSHGFSSKTEAVEMALREMDRRSRFMTVVKKGMGLTPVQLAQSVEPEYDLLTMRVAETPKKYGKLKRP
jgi:xanthine dehydrogenase molybdopterin-binding subunit B